MKKFFTLIAAAMLAVGVNAQTLIDYPKSQDGITLSGSTVIASVKINSNTTSINGIKFGNSYMSNDALNLNYAVMSVEGGFKAGDVITIAGAFNNSDDTKKAAVDIFTVGEESAVTVLFTTQQFVNGRLVNDAPFEQTFTLTSDVEKLYFGRNGNTATFVTTLKVVRGEEKPSDPTPATVWNFQQNLSANDAANLAADAATWTFDEDNGYWKNVVTLTERGVFTALKANGAELDLTSGLSFTRDGSDGLSAERIRIAPAKFLAVNGGSMIISFGFLVKDDVVRLIFKGAGDSERSLSLSNTELLSGELTTADTEIHTAELKVLKDNVVNITTSNGFQFLAFSINDDITSGIQGVKTVSVENGAIYNLAGQKVNANFKGIAIQNGKKVVLK